MDIRSHMSKYTLDKLAGRPKKIAVFMSGGLDSTIMLHHLIDTDIDKKMNIKGYHLLFIDTKGRPINSVESVLRAANYYNTECEIVELTAKEYLNVLPLLMKDFPRPRYNVWPDWLMERAEGYLAEQVWIGEGADELFGYPDRDFLEGWAGQLVYIKPTYEQLAEKYTFELHMPYHAIRENIGEQYQRFYHPPNKMRLRQAYDGIIPPEFLLRPASPPDFVQYDRFFGRENAKAWLHKHTIKTWLEVHS